MLQRQKEVEKVIYEPDGSRKPSPQTLNPHVPSVLADNGEYGQQQDLPSYLGIIPTLAAVP